MKESKTTYAYLIEHMQEPSFLKVWDIAFDFVRKLPAELSAELHESLNRGVDVLDSEPLLQMYIYAFGKMHNAKLLHAFNHMQERVVKTDQLEIVDYGCGQGLASLCYHDFIKEHNPLQKITKITLIEPSPLALSRAELLCSCFYPNAEIIAVNKQFDDLIAEDIRISSEVLTLHLFSNILDVVSYDLHHLIQTITKLPSEKNEYVIVSPIQNTLRTQRLKTFALNVGGFIYYENYLDKRQLDEERDWTCAVLLCSSITKEERDESECDKVFEEARSFIENKDNDLKGEDSIALFHRLKYCAELGDKRCQNMLGIWYKDGVGTEHNFRLAFEWFQKSAEQEYAPALGNIGDLYLKGLGLEVDNLKAVHYYKEGANRKHSGCQYHLGVCYLEGIGVTSDKNIAFSLFMESTMQGCTSAMFMLYQCYLNGWGIEKDEDTAIKYLKKAAKKKQAESCYILGGYYQFGKYVDKNEQKSLKLYRESAKQGYAPAQKKLGDIYRQGLLGNGESPKESFNWYLKAAEQGNSSAQFYAGYFYASGYGVKKDVNLAFEWYSKAADQNSPAALNNLAICYEYGKGTEIDLTKAACYYEKSAKLGNITAQKNLAICYKNGTGVELNPQKVFYWTLKAAINGDSESIGMIALYYLKGYGANKSNEDAFMWYAKYYSDADEDNLINNVDDAFNFFSKKAEDGDPQALYIIGKCLQYGVTTNRDIKGANTYFEKAAKLRHIESLIKVRQVSTLYELCSIKEDKNSFKDVYGVVYSADKKILINANYQETKYYTITKGTRIIGDNAFCHKSFEKIVIPSSVLLIGKNPFTKSVRWGGDLKEIECLSANYVVSGSALYTRDKKKLISYFGKASKFKIPNGVKIIGAMAFEGNTNLTEVVFPNSLCSIEDEAFSHCLKLTRITLPKNVTDIGVRCFYGCESLSDVLSLGNVKTIKEETFMGCNIKQLFLPESLVEIGDNAFNSTTELNYIVLPNSVKKLGDSCFAFSSLMRIILNENLQEIGNFCFYKCTIDSITIPSQVKIIGTNPFIGTKNVECNRNNRFFAENGLLYNKEWGELISCYGDSEIALFPPIKQINSFAFTNSEVTDIFIGENIIKLEPWAFYEASKLERVFWKKCKIEKIPLGCFGECSKLSIIDIPFSIKEIHDKTFFGDCKLKKIRFCGCQTNASEKIFLKERSIGLPKGYRSPYLLRGSTITDIDFGAKKKVDTSQFPTIEIIVPQGCSKKYSFPSIHGYESYGMARNFVVTEYGKD